MNTRTRRILSVGALLTGVFLSQDAFAANVGCYAKVFSYRPDFSGDLGKVITERVNLAGDPNGVLTGNMKVDEYSFFVAVDTKQNGAITLTIRETQDGVIRDAAYFGEFGKQPEHQTQYRVTTRSLDRLVTLTCS